MSYYYNLATGEIEFGKRSRGFDRMGPFETLDEARQALANAQERNDAWEDEDKAWADSSSESPSSPDDAAQLESYDS